MKAPKVLLGCPTSDYKEYCLEEFAEGLKRLTYPNFDILLIDNSEDDRYYNKIKSLGIPVLRSEFTEKARDRIVRDRNILRKKVLDEDYDYFFSLEQDVIPPFDVIERMIKRQKKIVSGIYCKEYYVTKEPKVVVIQPLIYKKVSEDPNALLSKVQQFKWEEVKGDDLIEIGACGVGCLLIHRDILKDIEFRYDPERDAFDDMWFCIDADLKGFKIYADCSIKCKHLVQGMDWNQIKK